MTETRYPRGKTTGNYKLNFEKESKLEYYEIEKIQEYNNFDIKWIQNSKNTGTRSLKK